jgi:plasmid stability protein
MWSLGDEDMTLRNTTLNLPDELVQRTKAYAAQHGTTMTAIVRAHLETITATARSARPEALEAYSKGLLDRGDAIRALGLRDHADLLVALGAAGLPMPMPPPNVVDNQATNFERIWKQS